MQKQSFFSRISDPAITKPYSIKIIEFTVKKPSIEHFDKKKHIQNTEPNFSRTFTSLFFAQPCLKKSEEKEMLLFSVCLSVLLFYGISSLFSICMLLCFCNRTHIVHAITRSSRQYNTVLVSVFKVVLLQKAIFVCARLEVLK